MTNKVPDFPASFVDLLLDAVLLVDVDGRIVYVNAACERIFGYSPEELIGQSMIDHVVPEDRARTLEEAKRVMAGHPRVGFENRYIRKDGRHVHIMWSARWSETDRLRVGVARDVTANKQAEELQAATYAVSEAAHAATDLATLFREISQIIGKLVPLAGLAVATYKPGTKQLCISYEKDFPGLPPEIQEQFLNRCCTDIVRNGNPSILPDEDRPGRPAGETVGADQAYLVMPLVTRKEAIGALILTSRTGYSDKDKKLLHFVSAQIATAIERKRLIDELAYSARYDELTGLPNRRLFYDRMKSALARSRRRQSRGAVLFIDIDGFKRVNDSFGHATGDLLLKKVALRLKQCVREDDTVARLGGDEFVVLVEDIAAASDTQAIADKIRNAIATPITVDEAELRVVASIGTAVYPEHGMMPEQLVRRADEAMYLDKKSRITGTSRDA
ncbi:diguanylate cyclase [Bordetella genomosp. 11]|uniref:Diguanylate cyclase n=2 Tax=Bordetella genomosp. 11 TaxID=1416808 RepID=A0A261ULE1_9BORD|nr:diguanylate cyclase [Bordetella genomosp. 11]